MQEQLKFDFIKECKVVRTDICACCHRTRHGPMLRDEIWRQLADDGEAFLCAVCMDERANDRLGRKLMLADLRPCPFNLSHRPHSWFDVLVEAEDAQPNNLANGAKRPAFAASSLEKLNGNAASAAMSFGNRSRSRGCKGRQRGQLAI
jgi:hypothetical protein